MGFFEAQAAGPSVATITGGYFFGSVRPSVGTTPPSSFLNPTVTSGEFSSPGNGDATITTDLSRANIAGTSLLLGETGSLAFNVAPSGRGTDSKGDIYYPISPSKLLMLIPNASGSTSPNPPTAVINIFQQ